MSRKCVCVFQRCVWIETCVSKLKAGCVCLSRCEGRQIKSVLNESDMFIASVCDIISFYLRGNSWLNSRHTWAQLAHLTSGWAQALFSPALSRWWWWRSRRGFWTVFQSCGNLRDSELQRFEAAVLWMKMTENRSCCSAESSWTH